ncbi:MAG: prolyl oligopeptidase family serine peptidase [Rhodopseudomonas palustris]|nr:prolyl oligopeptidase family serine peptidase [Rhodopseudomonas palustris]
MRGGADKGWGWYLGRQARARRSTPFEDFAAAARALIANSYTAPKRIVGHGGSAGGMLMGAVANTATASCSRAFVAEVPFVDVLNTMLDDSLPLTPPEWPEWGNPIESEADFAPILSLLALRQRRGQGLSGDPARWAGSTDPRVTYWEPAKWVARLRATMTGGGPVLLRTNMGAGHGGASGFKRLDEVAIVYALRCGRSGWLTRRAKPWHQRPQQHSPRHCEERSDEAIQPCTNCLDCFAPRNDSNEDNRQQAQHARTKTTRI